MTESLVRPLWLRQDKEEVCIPENELDELSTHNSKANMVTDVEPISEPERTNESAHIKTAREGHKLTREKINFKGPKS